MGEQPIASDIASGQASKFNAELQFIYRDKQRQFRRHQIRLHSNGNLLCFGKILPSGKARTFNIAAMSDVKVQGYGPMDPYHLQIELSALTMTKYAFAKKLTDHRAFAGPPATPNFGDRVLGRCVEKLATAQGRVKQKLAPCQLRWMKSQGGWYPLLGTILHRATLGRLWRWHIVLTICQATDWMQWRLAEWRQARLLADDFHDIRMVNDPTSERRPWKHLRRARASVTRRLICVYLIAHFGQENYFRAVPFVRRCCYLRQS